MIRNYAWEMSVTTGNKLSTNPNCFGFLAIRKDVLGIFGKTALELYNK